MTHGEASAATAINQEFDTCAMLFDKQRKRQTTTKNISNEYKLKQNKELIYAKI